MQKFKLEMKELMDVLIQCEVHFIRCLKPNIKKSKDCYIGEYILQQINYLGVLESIKIRKEGFPFRKEYKRFLLDYSSLSINSKFLSKVNATTERDEHRKMAWVLLRNIILNEKDFFQKILYGINKINLKQDLATQLDKILLDKNRKVLIAARIMLIQFRIYRAKKNWKENIQLIKEAYLMISKTYKGHLCRKRYLLKRERAIRVQSLVRMRIARRKFRQKKAAMKKLTGTFMKNREKMFIEKLCQNNIFFKTWRELDQRITIRGFFKRYYKQVQLKIAFLAEKKANEQQHALSLMSQFLNTKILLNLMSRLRRENVFYRRFKKAFVRIKSLRIGFMTHSFLLIKMSFANFTKAKSKKIEEKKVKAPTAEEKNIAKIQKFYKKKMAKSRLNRIILRNTQLRLQHTNDTMILNRVTRLIKEKQLTKCFKIMLTAFEMNIKAEMNQENIPLLSIPELATRTFGKLEFPNLKKIFIQYQGNKQAENKHIRSYLYECFFLSKISESEFMGAPPSLDTNFPPELPSAESKNMGELRRMTFWDQLFKKEKEVEEEIDKNKLKKITSLLKHFKEAKTETKQLICMYDLAREGFQSGKKISEEIFHQIYLNLSEMKPGNEKYVSLLGVMANCLKITDNFFYLFSKKLYDIYSKNPNFDKAPLGYCAKAVKRSFDNPERKAVPSKDELLSIWRMKQSRVMIKISHSLCFLYYVENYCSVKDLLEILVGNLKISDISKYLGLYLDFNGEDYYLSEEKLVLEEINRLSEETGGTMLPFIYLRIKIFNNKMMTENDDYLILRYCAVLSNYLKGKYEITIEEMYELGSLAFLVDKGRYNGDELIIVSEVCPRNKVSSEKMLETAKCIGERYRDKSEIGITRKPAMISFLNILEHFERIPVFDCNYGIIKVDKYGKIISEELLYDVKLSFKEKCLVIFRRKDEKEIEECRFYKKIKAYGDINDGNYFVFRCVNIYDEIHIIENNKSKEIKGIMDGYVGLMGG